MSHSDTTVSGHPEGLPPEARNAEQEMRGKQAQDVAADAQREESHTSGPTESTKPESSGMEVAPASKGDLIDEMRRMENSGQIDMSAYAGEPNHDDEANAYGADTTDNDDDEDMVADGEELHGLRPDS
ncbi:hypothetical protein [Porphyrobacter sp. YT40]|uniref:hypothetical protein n=1 Tax=Porphyrobacter sp. YT40 TaxID=2547601 RepID=UPI001142E603|nr:hypothetical protein [Porphyrobacter sp. YT40]QDH33293.1 hypothetical protein E2E27_02455 [Porphyrobacter sp. YT40]